MSTLNGGMKSPPSLKGVMPDAMNITNGENGAKVFMLLICM